jgi:Amt family ammonium transporter
MLLLWKVGPRLTKDRERFPPNNVLLMLTGAGLLWLGWAGFNGGDPYSANIDSSIAVINTNICAAMSLLVWTLLDVIFFGKPSVIGAVQGMITGLVVITPAAGKIEPRFFAAPSPAPNCCCCCTRSSFTTKAVITF